MPCTQLPWLAWLCGAMTAACSGVCDVMLPPLTCTRFRACARHSHLLPLLCHLPLQVSDPESASLFSTIGQSKAVTDRAASSSPSPAAPAAPRKCHALSAATSASSPSSSSTSSSSTQLLARQVSALVYCERASQLAARCVPFPSTLAVVAAALVAFACHEHHGLTTTCVLLTFPSSGLHPTPWKQRQCLACPTGLQPNAAADSCEAALRCRCDDRGRFRTRDVSNMSPTERRAVEKMDFCYLADGEGSGGATSAAGPDQMSHGEGGGSGGSGGRESGNAGCRLASGETVRTLRWMS